MIQKIKSIFFKHPEEEKALSAIEQIIDERFDRGEKTLVDSHELTLLKNIFKLRDVRAGQVMIPRVDISGISDTISANDLQSLMLREQFTRIPVYHKTLDNVIGVLHVKDYLAALLKKEDITLKDIINKEVLFVPASIRALDLLRDMQKRKIQMAIVVDEYGGTDGLVTLEDLLEVVVGEIEDEHDAQDQIQMITQPTSSIIVADAKAKLEDIEIITGDFIDQDKLPDDIDTIGGYVFHLAGRLPNKGEIITHPTGVKFKVMDVDTRRIKRVKITNFASFQKKQDKKQKPTQKKRQKARTKK